MRVQQLIAKLENIKAANGDCDVELSVLYYSADGEDNLFAEGGCNFADYPSEPHPAVVLQNWQP